MSSLRTLLSFTFQKGFQKSKKLGHWTLGRWAKRCLKGVNKWEKKSVNKCFFFVFFLSRWFYTLYEQKFSNLIPFLSITFPQGFQKSRNFGHWTTGSGGKKTEWESVTNKQTNTHMDISTYRKSFAPPPRPNDWRWCFRRFQILKGIQIALLVQELRWFCLVSGFSLLVGLQ